MNRHWILLYALKYSKPEHDRLPLNVYWVNPRELSLDYEEGSMLAIL